MINWDTLKTAVDKEAELLALQSVAVRAERDKRLAATDFYMLSDAPTAPAGLTTYRHALRDITEQEGFPSDIAWPVL